MEIFINTLSFIVQGILLLRACTIFYKNPLDFGAIFLLLFLVFYAPACWDYFFDLGLFTNSFLVDFGVFTDDSTVAKFNAISTGIMLAFEMGYSLKRNKKQRSDEFGFRYNHTKYKIIRNSLLIVWLYIIYTAYLNYGGSIVLFFSPARKSAYLTGYASSFVVIIPTVLLTLKVLKDLELHNKIQYSSIFYFVILFASCISTGQRREMVNAFIFICLLLIMTNINKTKNFYLYLKSSGFRKKIMMIGLSVSVLVPTLWWARTYTTQVQRDSSNVIMPWEIRGWFELLFGSSTTGFQTSLILDNFDKIFGIQYLHSIYLMIVVTIPRSLFPDKPMTITKTIQYTLDHTGNISLFYVNDMYFNFGIFCFFASFLFGWIISKYYNSSLKSSHLINRIYAIIILAQIILLFKNGFAQYMIMIVQYLVLTSICMSFVFSKNKKQFPDKLGGSDEEDISAR